MSLDFSFELPYLDPSPSVHSALKAADELQAYLDMHGDDCHQESFLQIKCLITEKLITAPKQSKITDFFKK